MINEMYIVLAYNNVFMNNAAIVLGLIKKRRFCKLLFACGDIQININDPQ